MIPFGSNFSVGKSEDIADNVERRGAGNMRYMNLELDCGTFSIARVIANKGGLHVKPWPLTCNERFFIQPIGFFCCLDRGLHVARLSGGSVSSQFQLALASVPEPIGRSLQGEGESSNRESGEGRKHAAHAVKKLRDFNSKELSDLVAGAVFFLGLFGYLAYFVVTRDERKKQDDKSRPGAEPK